MARGVHVAGDSNGLTRDGGTTPGIGLLTTTSFSICGWHQITGNAATAFGHIPFSLRNSDPPTVNSFYIETDAGDANVGGPWGLQLWGTDSAGNGHNLGPTNIAVNEVWYYAVSLTNDGSGNITSRFYVAKDGDVSLTQVGTTAVNACTTFLRYLDLGWTGYSSEASNGDFTNWKIWSGAALSSSEFDSERKSEAAVRTSNLWGHWKLPNASDLTDSSGNGRTLTARSSVTDGAMTVNDIAGAGPTMSGYWRSGTI